MDETPDVFAGSLPALCVVGSYPRVIFLNLNTLEPLLTIPTDLPPLSGTNLRTYALSDDQIVVSTRSASAQPFARRDLFLFEPMCIDENGPATRAVSIDSTFVDPVVGSSTFGPPVQDVCELSESGFLVAGATNGHLVVLDQRDGRVRATFGCSIAGEKLSDLRKINRFGNGWDDWRHDLYVGTSRCLSLWDLETCSVVRYFRDRENQLDLVEGIGSSSHKHMVFCAGIDRHLSVFPRNLHKRIARVPLSNNGNSVLHCEDLNLIIVGCYHGNVQIFDTRQLATELSQIQVLGGTGMFAMTRIDERRFCSVGTDSGVAVFDIMKNEKLTEVRVPNSGAHYGVCSFPRFRHPGEVEVSAVGLADLTERVDFLLTEAWGRGRITTQGSSVVVCLYWL